MARHGIQVVVGVDIVEISRVRRLLAENPAAESEIFTEHETRYCSGKRQRHAHLAARFAAKEAVLKALGTGLGPRMRWADVEVVNDPLGRPRVRVHGEVRDRLVRLGGCVEVSLSHTGEYAVAHAALVVQPPAAAGTAPR